MSGGAALADRPMLTVKACAARLSLAYSSVYALIRAGKLRASQFGTALRVDRAELERFIAAHQVAPEKAAVHATPIVPADDPDARPRRTRAEERVALGVPVRHEFV